MKPKILYHFRTQGTGAEAVHISGMAKAFEGRGFEIVFSSPSGGDPRQTAGASPFRVGRCARLVRFLPGIFFELLELVYNLPAFLRNRRLLRQNSFSFVYERHAFFLFATALLAKRFALPLVVEVNELAGDERVRKQPWLAALARRSDRIVFERASLIVVVSPHLERRIAAMGIPAGRILVLPNAVHLADIRDLADGSQIRRRYGLEGCLTIGFVGWFVSWHRLDRLVGAFARLLRDRSTLRLVLVGEGPEGEALRGQVTNLGVADQVMFTGPVPHAEVRNYIAAFDIAVVLHSNAYRSPIKLFEYMAEARTVIAPWTEPVAAVVTDGESGLLFDPNSEIALRECLERALRNCDERRELGEQARQTVLDNHTWEANADRVWARIENLCKPSMRSKSPLS